MIEGLAFELRDDDAVFSPPRQPGDTEFEQAYQMMVTEETWQDPAAFGYIASPFENHVAMIARRSQELGITTEYSSDLLALKADVVKLQATMVSYDAFYQMVCACPEDFGMSQSFASKLFPAFGSGHESDHGKHDFEPARQKSEDEEDSELDPRTGRRRERRGLLQFLLPKAGREAGSRPPKRQRWFGVYF
jgi:hypothetical protein